MASQAAGLQTLAVELLYQLQMYALSENLPHVSRRLYAVFKSASPQYNAQYVMAREMNESYRNRAFTLALRYPICTEEVFRQIYLRLPRLPQTIVYQLPQRLFRALPPKASNDAGWSDDDQPLPYLRFLCSLPLCPDFNSHGGYALTKAVQARFFPLINFLLDHGASPFTKDSIAVMVAIHQRNLKIVKVLLESEKSCTNGGKRWEKSKRKLEETLRSEKQITQNMLRMAVKCDANDIVEYLMRERGAVPDMRTLKLMR